MNLARGEIDPGEFFEENWITEGMRTLLRQAFLRSKAAHHKASSS
jgi:predicted AAA+ superfamily ATPase